MSTLSLQITLFLYSCPKIEQTIKLGVSQIYLAAGCCGKSIQERKKAQTWIELNFGVQVKILNYNFEFELQFSVASACTQKSI